MAHRLLTGLTRFTAPTPSVGPTTLILDQFTDANGTALSAHAIAPTNTPGGSWSTVGYTISGNKAINSSASDYDGIGVNTGLTDLYAASVETDSAEVGPAVRVQDATHNFFAIYDSVNFRLYENNAGLILRAIQAVSASAPFTITIELSGNLITAKLAASGVVVATISYTSSNFAASTKAGMAIRKLTASWAADNFKVTTL